MRIMSRNITGEIIDDIIGVDGKRYYFVESDIPGIDDTDADFAGYWPSWAVPADDLELI